MPKDKKGRRGTQAPGRSQSGQRAGRPPAPERSAAARREAQRELRLQAARRQSQRLWLWVGGGAVAAVALAGLLFFVASRSGAGGAGVGDHWHASINIRVCGQSYTPPPSPGGVHSHGDGVIHIHPTDALEAGENANLARFFESTGIDIGAGHVRLPGDPEYRDGASCPGGGAGRLRVLINGSEKEDFLSYAPRDGDRIEVLFG